MPELHIIRTLTSLQYSESSARLHVFLDASKAALAAVAYLVITHNYSEVTETCFLFGKGKVAPIKLTSVPKLEFGAAVIGLRLPKKQPVLVANRLREIAGHISTLNNPTHHGTPGLDSSETSLKWLQLVEFLSS